MKKIWTNAAHSFKEAEEFDIRFWKEVGSRGRFAAAWACIKDLYKIRGISGHKLRLRRSVQSIQREQS